MPILFSGDYHANSNAQIKYISKNELLLKYRPELFSRIKYHVILGDGGFRRPGNRKADLSSYNSLAFRPFPVLCLIGDDDPVNCLRDAPEVDIGIGETVCQIHDSPFIAYLKPGKTYCIDGIKCLVLGGALSAFKECWPEQKKQDVYKLLETDNSFDLVLSHTGPHHMNKFLFGGKEEYSGCFSDEAAFFNEEIHDRANFIEWWCGHWHRDIYCTDEETNQGYQYLYKTTKVLEKQDEKITLYTEYGMSRVPV